MTDDQETPRAEGEPARSNGNPEHDGHDGHDAATPTTAELVRLLAELDSKIDAHFKSIGRASTGHREAEKRLFQRVFPGSPLPPEGNRGGE